MANRFEELPIFIEAHKLVLLAYKITKKLPEDEKFGLVSQLRRSASSISTNIIEGNARGHKKTFLEFLYIARGSLEETKYHILLSKDLNYVNENEYLQFQEQSEIVGRQLNGLIKYLKSSPK